MSVIQIIIRLAELLGMLPKAQHKNKKKTLKTDKGFRGSTIWLTATERPAVEDVITASSKCGFEWDSYQVHIGNGPGTNKLFLMAGGIKVVIPIDSSEEDVSRAFREDNYCKEIDLPGGGSIEMNITRKHGFLFGYILMFSSAGKTTGSGRKGWIERTLIKIKKFFGKTVSATSAMGGVLGAWKELIDEAQVLGIDYLCCSAQDSDGRGRTRFMAYRKVGFRTIEEVFKNQRYSHKEAWELHKADEVKSLVYEVPKKRG